MEGDKYVWLVLGVARVVGVVQEWRVCGYTSAYAAVAHVNAANAYAEIFKNRPHLTHPVSEEELKAANPADSNFGRYHLGEPNYYIDRVLVLDSFTMSTRPGHLQARKPE